MDNDSLHDLFNSVLIELLRINFINPAYKPLEMNQSPGQSLQMH